jgi:hypothetical protein
MRFVLVIIFILLRLIIIVLRANSIAIRVVLPGFRALCRISISAVPVTELVVKKLLYYPVRAIGGRNSETPDILNLRVPALSDTCYSFIFRLLFNITPVVGRGSLAVLLDAVFLGR